MPSATVGGLPEETTIYQVESILCQVATSQKDPEDNFQRI